MGKILINEEQLNNLSKNLLNEISYFEAAYDNTVDYLSGNQGWVPGNQSGVKSYLKGKQGLIPGDQTQLKKTLSSQWDKFVGNFRDTWEPINDKYLCVQNPELRAAVHTLIQNKEKIKKASGIQSDKLFLTILKMAIGTLGRESDYGQTDTWHDTAVLKLRALPSR